MRLKGIILNQMICLAGLVLAGILMDGCSRLEMQDVISGGGDKSVKVCLELGHPEAMMETGRFDTKSYLTAADIETRITDVTLAIYESGGTQAYLEYLTSGFGSIEVGLRSDKTYNIYAVANMGDQRIALASAVSGGAVSSMTYTVNYSSMASNGIPMSGSMSGQSFIDGQNVTVYLQRLLAKINVSLTCDWSGAVITAATVKNVNSKVSPFGTAPAGSTNPASLQDIHGAVAGTASTMSAVFYVPENPQGTVGSVLSSTQKTYSNGALSSIRDYATYLEVNVTSTGQYEGVVKYRSYLGSNQTTDFNILRNEVYDWTIVYHPGNLETYDWKRDNTELYYYRLECTGGVAALYCNKAHSSSTPRSGNLNYSIVKYNARTGEAVQYQDATISTRNCYTTADGNETSNLVSLSSSGAGVVQVAVSSGYAGPVYVDITSNYNGITYSCPRRLVHVNGVEKLEFLQSAFDACYQYVDSNLYNWWAIARLPFRVVNYNNGSRSYQNNPFNESTNYPIRGTVSGVPSGFTAQLYYTRGDEYYYVSWWASVPEYAPSGGAGIILYMFNNGGGVAPSKTAYHTVTVVYALHGLAYQPTSTLNGTSYTGYRMRCDIKMQPYNHNVYYVTPAEHSMTVGDSYGFRYYRQAYTGTSPNGAPTDLTSDGNTVWSIVSSTGGMEGLSLSGNTLTIGAAAHSGTVVIQARASNVGNASIGTATITVTGASSPGGIDDDWDNGGEIEL